MNCVKMSDVFVDFHCIESRQWFEVLHSWKLGILRFVLQFVLNLVKVLQSWYWQWGNKSGKSTLSLSHQQLVVNTSNTTPASFFLSVLIVSSQIVNTPFSIFLSSTLTVPQAWSQAVQRNKFLSYNIVKAEQSLKEIELFKLIPRRSKDRCIFSSSR